MTLTACERIRNVRAAFGGDLTIVGHHYQSEEVIRHTDIRGDSLELSRKTALVDSRYIMFCGVFFMAESAALLARDGQEVHMPVPSAECSMAAMADADVVRRCLETLCARGRKVVPLAYVNSTLGVKSVVGEFGGSVCTSANARVMLEWALSQGDAVLFLPDMNLGMNTADLLGLAREERCLLPAPGIGLNPGEAGLIGAGADTARLLLWPGYCSIHTFFTVDMVRSMRAAHAGARVVVHPESEPAVVAAADSAGSTSHIIRYAKELPDGGTLIIGTEINLVRRLARERQGRIQILPLAESPCSYMAETTESALADALEALARQREGGPASPFRVQAPDRYKESAGAALQRMLAVCA